MEESGSDCERKPETTKNIKKEKDVEKKAEATRKRKQEKKTKPEDEKVDETPGLKERLAARSAQRRLAQKEAGQLNKLQFDNLTIPYFNSFQCHGAV